MDTSEQYIKMCEIPELQVDYFDNHFAITNDVHSYRVRGVWLPRQDQLQEMVDGGFAHQTLERFYQWYHSGISKCLSSMEQLWLAFVMKEKYNKTWDGETWR